VQVTGPVEQVHPPGGVGPDRRLPGRDPRPVRPDHPGGVEGEHRPARDRGRDHVGPEVLPRPARRHEVVTGVEHRHDEAAALQPVRAGEPGLLDPVHEQAAGGREQHLSAVGGDGRLGVEFQRDRSPAGHGEQVPPGGRGQVHGHRPPAGQRDLVVPGPGVDPDPGNGVRGDARDGTTRRRDVDPLDGHPPTIPGHRDPIGPRRSGDVQDRFGAQPGGQHPGGKEFTGLEFGDRETGRARCKADGYDHRWAPGSDRDPE
jgi:hypothetical protein